ncbi:MAG: hypothetical protein WBM35_08075 [Candidatus Electrothrix sp.]
MDVRDAVKKAIEYVVEIFQAEKPENIGLEEVFLNEDENVWEITVGFSRPWDHPAQTVLATLQSLNPKRQYKVIKINNETEKVASIKIREPRSE